MSRLIGARAGWPAPLSRLVGWPLPSWADHLSTDDDPLVAYAEPYEPPRIQEELWRKLTAKGWHVRVFSHFARSAFGGHVVAIERVGR